MRFRETLEVLALWLGKRCLTVLILLICFFPPIYSFYLLDIKEREYNTIVGRFYLSHVNYLNDDNTRIESKKLAESLKTLREQVETLKTHLNILSVAGVLSFFGMDFISIIFNRKKKRNNASDASIPEVLFLRSFDTADRDSKNTKLYNKKVSGVRVGFLFLEPFVGGHISSFVGLFKRSTAVGADWIEYKLAQMFDEKIRFIAIGKANKGVTVGAMQIEVANDKWQEVALAHARNAAIIFYVPGTSPSVQWEANQLKNQDEFRQKTIWLMPFDDDSYYGYDDAEKKKRWMNIKNAFEVMNIHLPNFAAGGAAFLLDKGGAAHQVVSIDRLLSKTSAQLRWRPNRVFHGPRGSNELTKSLLPLS